MEIVTIFLIVIAIVIGVVLLKLLGKAVSLALSVLGIVIVVWLVVAGLRFLDINNIRDNFMDSNNLFLLEDGGDLVTGFATGYVEEALPDTKEELVNPNSKLYDDCYKVVVVKKDALPQKTALLIDASDDADRDRLFRAYVDNELMDGDLAENLVDAESEGDIEVYKETLAFRHGIREVIAP
jgi:hypothetical protein